MCNLPLNSISVIVSVRHINSSHDWRLVIIPKVGERRKEETTIIITINYLQSELGHYSSSLYSFLIRSTIETRNHSMIKCSQKIVFEITGSSHYVHVAVYLILDISRFISRCICTVSIYLPVAFYIFVSIILAIYCIKSM